MIVQCAWCQAYMGEIEPKSDYRISHGICRPCYAKVMAELGIVQVGGADVVLSPDVQGEAEREIARLGYAVEDVLL